MLRLLTWVVVLAASAAGAPLAEYFSSTTADGYVEAALRTLGDANSSASSKDYAARLLDALGNASAALGYKASACQAASTALKSGGLANIHHGGSLRMGVGCAIDVPADASAAVNAAMQVRTSQQDNTNGSSTPSNVSRTRCSADSRVRSSCPIPTALVLAR